jgi:hypothetical protein
MFLSWRGISKYHSISRDSGGNVQLLSFVLQTSPERVTVSIRVALLYNYNQDQHVECGEVCMTGLKLSINHHHHGRIPLSGDKHFLAALNRGVCGRAEGSISLSEKMINFSRANRSVHWHQNLINDFQEQER